MGGLGNQLFQYAIGRSLSIQYNTDLVLDLSWYDSIPSSNTHRDFELSHYAIVARSTNYQESIWCRLHSSRLWGRVGVNWGGFRSFNEKNYDFTEIPHFHNKSIYLSGYWQSYLYFNSIVDLLRAELVPIQNPNITEHKLIDNIINTNSVSVHIRRGDYFSQKAASNFHGLCSLDYYKKAFDEISRSVTSPIFFVFSDDFNWVKDNMCFPGEVIFVDHDNCIEPYQHLRLMSICRHNVIANSSFSWWGAWLNSNPRKIVVAPKKWFNNCSPTPTLMPLSWLRL